MDYSKPTLIFIPVLLARIENDEVTFAAKFAMKKKWIKSGLPSIAQKIKLSLSN